MTDHRRKMFPVGLPVLKKSGLNLFELRLFKDMTAKMVVRNIYLEAELSFFS